MIDGTKLQANARCVNAGIKPITAKIKQQGINALFLEKFWESTPPAF